MRSRVCVRWAKRIQMPIQRQAPIVMTSGLRSYSCSTKVESKRKFGEFSVDRTGLINDHLLDKDVTFPASKEEMSPLAKDLISFIQWKGPISLHDYMAQALNHVVHGYYQSKNEKIGQLGDFITAPELSQLFGEMIGLWALLTWKAMGSPPRLNLVELGPGKGTLMKDLLRVSKRFPEFHNAISIHFVELSRELRKVQLEAVSEVLQGADNDKSQPIKDTLPHSIQGKSVAWYSLLQQVPNDSPSIIIGQEFLDAFPVHQFVYTEKGWREKLVDIDQSADSQHFFRFVLSPGPTPAVRSLLLTDKDKNPDPQIIKVGDSERRQSAAQVKVGDGLEISPLAISTCEDIAKRIAATGGAAILIDYGEDFTQEDSLRGFKNHNQVNILSEPGKVDTTADVDFSVCRKSAERRGAAVFPLLTQGQFLMNMGITHRVEQLINGEHVTDEEASNLFENMKKLVLPEAMGTKFKVQIFSHPDLKTSIPGFQSVEPTAESQ